ncbi:hypothetical protein H2200_011427 [Cladophialophora chaetospira]|uniref:DNA (cytosine-5-)-methyltransferase n=1 Tax=Cladophialophora chaetospira TaxID=386627 RepID=A0AA39CD44_9EURO|nr:hypothetical protein H2200_011427 [Cladophialophora chaetospira]
MPRLQDLHFDLSIDDDSEEGVDVDESSGDWSSASTDTDHRLDLNEEPASETEEDIVLVQRPPRRAISSVDQDAVFAKRLGELESPEDIKKLYPRRFATTPSSTGNSQYEAESTILKGYISIEAQHTDHQDPDRDSEPGSEYDEFDLADFCVYQSLEGCFPVERKGFEGQYESLHIVSANLDTASWHVDGTIIYKDRSRSFIRGDIVEVCIGALEDTTENSAANWIWIQTSESQKTDHWYKLKRPAKSYEQYWTDFVWLADFAKYFIDFLHVKSSSGVSVCLAAFESSFWKWLEELHGHELSGWHGQCGNRTDFRQYVLNHCQVLRNQVYSLQKDSYNQRLSHQIWDEVNAGFFSHDRQAISRKEKTGVTEHVAHSFLKTFPYWQKEHRLFDIVEKSAEVDAYGKDRRRKWKFPNKLRVDQAINFRITDTEEISRAALILEQAATDNQPVQNPKSKELLRAVVVVRVPLKEWDQYDFRYAWVRAVSQSDISVVWLALPKDTFAIEEKKAFYPIGNELFFTDECNCNAIPIGNVIKIIKASVFTDHAPEGCHLFVHSLYRLEEEVHVNAVESELRCSCQKKSRGRPKQQQPVHKKLCSVSTSDVPKMKSCALCSGCGLLDHAFCATGMAETILAVEHDEAAARSHRANNPSTHCEYLIDSVNPALRRYINGKKPLPFEIDCLIAGCPCQGWSALNQNKGRNDYKSQKNCSILANMMSWIEVFMPAYVLLENVPNMDRTSPSACAEAICHLVALGYQVRKSIRIDGEVGGVSTRKRLFVIAAAPGAILPDEIPITRKRYGNELRKFRTAWRAISDLDPIENDTTLNHKDPDHIPLQRLKINWDKDVSFRSLVSNIKTSLHDAYETGSLSQREEHFFRGLHKEQRANGSKVLKRIDKDEPFRTMVTVVQPMDARLGGETIHTFQNRLISLREVSRAMGVPDWFLLAGNMVQKHHQLGNGVPWALGEGWGKQFARAWVKTLERREKEKQQPQDAENGRVENVSVQMSITTSASAEETAMRGRGQATSETFHTETVIRTRRPRRVIDSDDSDVDLLGDAVTKHVAKASVTTPGLTMKFGAESHGGPFTTMKQNRTDNGFSEEEYSGDSPVPKTSEVFLKQDVSVRHLNGGKLPNATQEPLGPMPKQPARASSQKQPFLAQSTRVDIDLTGDSDDEPSSHSVDPLSSEYGFKARTPSNGIRRSGISGKADVQAGSIQRSRSTPQKRRAPEGLSDLSDDELQAKKKSPVVEVQSPKKTPVVFIPSKRTKQ